jgi:hypothetical protein
MNAAWFLRTEIGEADAGELTLPIHCGRPLVYPVNREELPGFLRGRSAATGSHFYGVLFAFDLEQTGPVRYAAAQFSVCLADQRAVAVQIRADGDALGLLYGTGELRASTALVRAQARLDDRLRWLPPFPACKGLAGARVTGTQSHAFRSAYNDPRGETTIPPACAMHALIEVPKDLLELAGIVTVDATILRTDRLGRARCAAVRKAVYFSELLPGAAPEPAAAVRLCVAADIEGYSDRHNQIAEWTQLRMVEVLTRARRRTGIAEREVSLLSQGDEVFAVLPVGIDESWVIPTFVESLAAALREVNEPAGTERIRLRVAMHRGLMKKGPSGWVGKAPVAVHRILNASELHVALADHPGADFVLGVPDMLYQDVLVHSYAPLYAEAFRKVTVDVPEKGFREQTWIYVPS